MAILHSIKTTFVFFFLFFSTQILFGSAIFEQTKYVGTFNKLAIKNIQIPVRLNWANFQNSVCIKTSKKNFDALEVFNSDGCLSIGMNWSASKNLIAPEDAEIIINCGSLSSISLDNCLTLDCRKIIVYGDLFISAKNCSAIKVDRLTAQNLKILAGSFSDIEITRCFIGLDLSVNLSNYSNFFIENLHAKKLILNEISDCSSCDILVAEVKSLFSALVKNSSKLNINFKESCDVACLAVSDRSDVVLFCLNVLNSFSTCARDNSNIIVRGQVFRQDVSLINSCGYEASGLRCNLAEIFASKSSEATINEEGCAASTVCDESSLISSIKGG